MKKLFLLFFLSYQTSYSLPIDSTVYKYFPLNVGNRWTWYLFQPYNPGPGYETLRILNSFISNGKVLFRARYDAYYISSTQHDHYIRCYRIDSLTGNLYKYDSLGGNECLTDSLNSMKDDSSHHQSCDNPWSCWFRCDTGTYNIFNQSQKEKQFGWTNYFEAGGWRIYAKNFGEVYERYD